jgi:hypothetical protein
MQIIVQEITDEIFAASHLVAGDSVAIRIVSHEYAWIAEQAIIARLKSLNCRVFMHGDSGVHPRYLFDVTSSSVQTRYHNMFRDGVFGTHRVEREIRAEISGRLENSSVHELLYGGSLSKNLSDTVDVDDIDAIEQEDIKATHGELPSADFLDRIVEPFIIIGAAGAAIYLLFHVRS